jgi:peptidoglycan-associated lipoprotein
MKRLNTSFATLAVATLLSACSSTPIATDGGAAMAGRPSGVTTSPSPSDANARPAPSSTVASVNIAPHNDPNNPISRDRSIYFDYEDYSIKSQYNEVIVLHGNYLHAHPGLAVRIEGNADERGSAEYNLSLGQKRSEAVVRALKIYGVKDSQTEAVSYGKERPKATGHDEAAWAQNRRADIVYRSK